MLIEDNIVVDPAVQRLVMARVQAGHCGDVPDQAVHDLGLLDLPEGKAVRLHLRHAVDPIIIDGHGQVVLITRRNSPGKGLFALPGGFIDEVDGKVEAPLETAIREAVEETGINAALLRQAGGVAVGPRRFARGFDIRCAYNDPPGTPIKQGELFNVSTQGICFRLAGNLLQVRLHAGDDAKAVSVVKVAELRREQLAAPDHLEMIEAARQLP